MRKRTGALSVVLLALALLALPAQASAAPDHPFLASIFKWVPEPNVTEYFEGPCGLATDSSGDVYVSDYYHNKIHVFSSGGAYKTRILEVEPLDGPCGLAVESGGSLFVNVMHRSILKYVPAVFPLGSKTAYGAPALIDSDHPTGVDFDSGSGNIYVNDRTYVTAYEPSGAQVLDEGVPLKIGLGSLEDAYGVAVSAYPGTEGFVYAADAADNTVKVFDPATDPLNPVAVIDGAGTPQGGFKTLRDAALAIDHSNGHLFVIYNSQGLFYEHPKAAVAEFNAAGEYRGTLPAPSPLWFGEPSGIAVDNSGGATQGTVYLTTGNSEVETAGLGAGKEKPEEGAVYAFGPVGPGHRLEVTLAGAGEGSVKSAPAGINCPGACSAEYDEGEIVELTAMPEAGSALGGWSGSGCSGTGSCVVTMSEARAVSAEFEVAPAASGSVSGGSEPPPGALATTNATAPASAGATIRVTSPSTSAAQRARKRRRALRRLRARARRAQARRARARRATARHHHRLRQRGR